ncbi:MAG: T9SS type A sorting domain-containing protein [Bacteroidota bacterium]
MDIFRKQIIVSSTWEDENAQEGDSLSNAGAAYVYGLDSLLGFWTFQQKLVASDRQAMEEFGTTVAAGEGVLMVGVPNKEHLDSLGNVYSASGRVYVFQPDSSGAWIQTQQLQLPFPKGGDHFGHAIAISGDFVAIGVPEEDEDANGTLLTDAGSVYLYRRNQNDQWQFHQQITSSDREIFDWFGHSIDLQDSLLIVGAIWEEEDTLGQHPLPGAGSAYIYRLQASGMWEEESKIISPNRGPLKGFGQAVTIEGEVAVVSEVNTDHGQFGTAYLYQKSAGGVWEYSQELPSSDPSINHLGLYGNSLDMDEGRIIIGGPRIPFNFGKIYLFEACQEAFSFQQDSTCMDLPYAFGDQWLTTSGQYLDTLLSEDGCDSVVVLDLTVQMVETQLIETDTALQATATDASFQWLNCTNGYLPISGAHAAEFVPSASGSYAVEVTQFGCSDTSDCVSFLPTNIAPDWATGLRIFPNPTTDQITIVWPDQQPPLTLELLDLTGRSLMKQALRPSRRNQFPLPPSSGIYLLSIRDAEGGRMIRKIEKR